MLVNQNVQRVVDNPEVLVGLLWLLQLSTHTGQPLWASQETFIPFPSGKPHSGATQFCGAF